MKLTPQTATPFFHREQEMADLTALAKQPKPVFVIIYGRRRVGKSRLIKHWAHGTGLPFFYWESPRQSADMACLNSSRPAPRGESAVENSTLESINKRMI